MRNQNLVPVLSSALLAACGGSAIEGTAPAAESESTSEASDTAPAGPSSTAEVLGRHLAAFGSRDMDALLADFAPDAVVVTQLGTLKGHANIRPAFQAMFDEFARPGATFQMGDTLIDGDVAYITWSAETADSIYELATDTFVVIDGKIAYQTFAGQVTPKVEGGPETPVLTEPPPSPSQEVLSRHLQAFGAGKLADLMADYSETPVFLSNLGRLDGTEAITGLFAGLIAEFSKPGMKFNMRHMAVEGEVAFIVWSAETADNSYEWVADTFVIRDGRIAYQTLAAVVTPKN